MTDTRTSPHAILFATDFSPASEPAARVAREYAGRLGAHVHLVHVTATDTAIATARLTGLATAFAPAPTVTRVLAGTSPAAAIVAYAREHAIDLVVLGTHGRTGWSHALLGSVAELVVRTASCPVLTVPATMGGAAADVGLPHGRERRCLVCAAASEDLVCERCRAHIRGELLERKQRDERPGRV
jgi:nucleotide-binding universal stress UspA family protein